MTAENRQAAQDRIADLARLLQSTGDSRMAPILAECEALSRAIGAFHMEGIRFRIYNVDRLLRSYVGSAESAGSGTASTAVASVAGSGVILLEEARRHLEAAGFHTRSHQAPI
jgi:hypothetical protein